MYVLAHSSVKDLNAVLKTFVREIHILAGLSKMETACFLYLFWKLIIVFEYEQNKITNSRWSRSGREEEELVRMKKNEYRNGCKICCICECVAVIRTLVQVRQRSLIVHEFSSFCLVSFQSSLLLHNHYWCLQLFKSYFIRCHGKQRFGNRWHLWTHEVHTFHA